MPDSYAMDIVVIAACIVDGVIVVTITETVIHHTSSVSNNLPNRI